MPAGGFQGRIVQEVNIRLCVTSVRSRRCPLLHPLVQTVPSESTTGHSGLPVVIKTRGNRRVTTCKQQAIGGAGCSERSGKARNKGVCFQERVRAADCSSSVFVPWIVLFDSGDFS